MVRACLTVLFTLLTAPVWAGSIPFQTDKTAFTEGSGGIQVIGACFNDVRGGNITEDNVGCLRATNKGDLHDSPYDSGGTAMSDTTAHALKVLSVDSTGATVVPSTIVTDASTITRGQTNVLLSDVALFADNGSNYARLQADASGNLKIVNIPVTTGGTTPCYLSSAATTNATNCKASAGQLYGFDLVNTTGTLYYLRLYNLAAAPTCSSATGFIRSIPIPASTTGAGITRDIAAGEAYSTGLGFCLTGGGGTTDNTAAGTGVFVSLNYK